MRLWQWQQHIIDGKRASPEFMQFLIGLVTDGNDTAAAVAAITPRVTSNVGPYYNHNVVANATTTLEALFSTAAGSVNRTGINFAMPTSGRIIGAYLMSSVARIAGNATLQVTVNGVASSIGSAVIRLDATNTQTTSGIVAYADGVAFAAGDTVGASVDTSILWEPLTADLQATLIVAFDNV